MTRKATKKARPPVKSSAPATKSDAPARKSEAAAARPPAQGSRTFWVLLWVFIGIVGLSMLAGVLFWQWYIIDVKEVPMEVTVTDTGLIGFNTGTDKLYFGTVTPEGMSERQTTAVSSKESVVTVKLRGEIAPWVSVSRNNVRLEPNVREDIIFRLTAPPDARPGNYTGTAIIQYRRVMPWE